jgi:hypothetical protein
MLLIVCIQLVQNNDTNTVCFRRFEHDRRSAPEALEAMRR